MKIIFGYVLTSCLFFSTPSFAYTECERPIKNIWNNLTKTPAVWITFSDGGSAISRTEAQITPGQMSRFIAFALTAQTTGKLLIVRYPEDGLICPPKGAKRSDSLGIWIKG